MKLENIEFGYDSFVEGMTKLKNEKHFDYLVTIVGEDFGEEGLGCVYILENTETHERVSVKQMRSTTSWASSSWDTAICAGCI